MKNYTYGLFLFLLGSVLLMSFNINHIDMAAANSDGNISKDFGNLSNLDTIIELPLPTACLFDDGDNPKIDKCDPISNNGETLESDNIFFTLNSSPRSFDSFTCTLQVQNGAVITSFDCRTSSNIAEAQFDSLEDGDYVFTVTAERTISDNDTLTQDTIQEAASPPFNFRVGIGGGGGFNTLGEQVEESHFGNLLINEKLGFINLEKKLKNNEITNTTSLACLTGETFEGEILKYKEFNCNRLLIFAITSPTSTFVSNMSEQGSPYSNDMYIYKVNNALSNGINGYLVSCGLTEKAGASSENNMKIIWVNPIPCRDIFIVYEISS